MRYDDLRPDSPARGGLLKYIACRVLRAAVIPLCVALLVLFILSLMSGPAEVYIIGKPVIYLYPERETEVRITLELDGALIKSVPEYGEGWRVTAMPDGTLIDRDGASYPYLFWEAEAGARFDMSRGFCVKKDELADFLEGSLTLLGLNARERGDFCEYWLPLMEKYPCVLVAFQGESYTRLARLETDPRPDSLLRVFMAWRGLNSPVDIPPQTLEPFERTGFTVVEWGGSEISRP